MSETLIQKYLDKEVSLQEQNQIENHILHCQTCCDRVNEQKKFISQIQQDIRNMDEGEIQIPEFIKPKKEKATSSHKILKRFIYTVSVAVACCLMFWLFMPSQESKNEQNLIFVYEIDGEFDANRPIAQQDYQIHIIDQEQK